MKTFKKVLASALAAAMVVTAFPVANAEAATAPKLSATKATLYVGQSKTITVKNVAKGSKVTATSSNKKAATVSVKGTKVTVKSVKKGTAKVTVKVTPKKGAAKKLTAKITVKTPTVKFTDSVTEAKIATPVKVKATATPAVSVKYYSADKNIATVGLTSGTVTGKTEGTVKIAAVIKTGTKTTKAYKEVEVVNAITAKAVSTKKIDVTFAGAIEKAEKANFTVTDNKGAAALIKSVTLDATKKVVTVEFYSALTSGNSYKVVVKNGEKSYEASVDYVKGAVAKIEAADQLVQANTASAIKYTVYDENGLDITENTNVVIDATVPVTSGKVNLAKGAIAYATVIYTNPTNGAQVKSAQFKISATDVVAKSIDAVVVSGAAVTVAGWPKKDVNTSVVKGTNSQVLTVLYTDIWGTKQVTTGSAVSANPDILIVDSSTNTLTALKEGTATVNVKLGEVSAAFQITVKAPAAASTIALDTKASKTTTTLTVADALGTKTPAKLVVNVLDQYGNKANSNATLKFEETTDAKVVTYTAASLNAVPAGTAATFTPIAAGTTYFKVSVNNNTKVAPIYVAVTVSAADQAVAAYKLVNLATTYDLNGDNAETGAVSACALKLAAVNKTGEIVNNPAADTVSGATVTLKTPAGDTITLGTTDNTGAVVSGGPVKLNVKTNLTAVGDYAVTVIKGSTTYDSVVIKVVDSAAQPAVGLKVAAIKTSTKYSDLIDIPEGFTLSNISFVSNASAVVASLDNATVTSADSLIVKTAGEATLYNVKVVLTKGTRNFTVSLPNISIIK